MTFQGNHNSQSDFILTLYKKVLQVKKKTLPHI